MIFKPSSLHKFFFTYICPRFYGDAPKMPSQPATTTQNINSIPSQLMPYYKKMLNSAQTLTQNTYTPYSTDAGDYVAPFSPLQKQAQAGAAALQTPGQFEPASTMAGLAGIGQLGTAQEAQGYGAQGANLGMGSALTSANQAGMQQAQAGMYGGMGAGYGAQSAEFGQEAGMGFGGMGAGYGSQAAGMAGQGYGAGAQFAQQATDPNAVAAYMNPYVAQSLAPQLQLLNQEYGIKQAQQQGAATQAGAFGGSREALMGGLNSQAQSLAQQKMISEGYNNAFNNAQQQQQFGANLNLQGMAAGQSALGMGIQGAQAGLQGANTALQGYQQGISGAQAGLQGVNAQTNASQMQQAGVGQGLQGIGYGLQGLNTAQQGYTGAANAGATLGNLGTAQLGAETSVLGTQAQFGGQQQAQQQQAINQAILNYQNAQQYPYMQLGFMSDLLRGTQTGNTTQTQYQAQPGMASQIGGLAATGLGAYAALRAEGGVIKDKGYAKGGIVGYKVGGDIEESMRSKLEDLDIPHLQQVTQNKESPKMASIAKEVLATKFARGGIVAFADEKDKEKGSQVDEEEVIGGIKPLNIRPKKMLAMQEQAPPGQAAGIAPIQAATLGPMSTEESLKNMAANQAQGIKPPLQTSAMSATPAATTPFNMNAAISGIQEEAEKSRLAADRPLKDLIAEDRETRERELGPDTATIEYRKSIMEEKANSKDEMRRQMGMRLMEFGANWASTPGAPLIAGMRALKEELPLYMEDTKANKKAMKELDQSIYMLDHAKRLEDEGYIDRATAWKQRAQDSFIKIAPQAIDAAVKKETLSLQEQQNKITQQHYKATEANQAAALAQNAEQFKITSAQPTAAGMKEQAIKEVMKAKDVGYGTAYGIVEGFGPATKDPRLGYEVELAGKRYTAAMEAAAKAFTPDAKDAANRELADASLNLTRLQNAISSTGMYGVSPPPLPGPRAGAGQNRIPLSSFQK